MLGSLGASSSIFQASLATLLVLGATEPLDAVEPQADIGFDGACGERIEQLSGVATALHHRDARRDLLLLRGGKQLGDAERGFGGRLARQRKSSWSMRAW